jgi:protein-disulfide isomerase
MKVRQVLAVVALAGVITVPAYAKKEKKQDAKAAPAAAASASKVVATVGTVSITEDELNQAAFSQLMKVRQQEYEIKEQVLDGLVQQKLLEMEAAARSMALPDLLKAEVEDKTVAPTKEEMDRFYEQNKSRMGGRTREDAAGDIERTLRNQKAAQRRGEFLDELVAKNPVKTLLEPMRIPQSMEVPPNAFAKGPATAPVTIVEYSDYQCPFCRRAHPTMERVLKEYGDKVRFVYRDYPLNFHPRAVPSSVAARCAAEQGKFWEYHTNLMEVNGDLSDADLGKRATDLSLDMAAFDACYASKKFEAAIQSDFQAGAAVGVTGTPAFFVNGRMIVGARPFEDFKNVIDDELQRATTK